MRNIIIYGGSFNPLHKAHDAIIAHCLQLKGFDEVWVMPSAKRLDKPTLLDDEIRLSMLYDYATKQWPGTDRLQITDFEMKLGQPSETTRTYTALRNTYKDTHFTFIFGTDSIADMINWQDGAYLVKNLPVIVVARQGVITRPSVQSIHGVDSKFAHLSSTKVRQLAGVGTDISPYVPSSVAHYIKMHKLYQ